MPYSLHQWPDGVYPGELGKFPTVLADIDTVLVAMRASGPRLEGFSVKNLGKKLDGLWQLNLKSDGRQVRILFAPYGDRMVVFLIHKKSSPEEQKRAYKIASKRKRELDTKIKGSGKQHVATLATIH
jgi:hypothetical protein